VEDDAAAQLELPNRVLDHAPGFGEAGLRPRIGVAVDKCLVEMARGGHVGTKKEVMRIDVEF
jgi:hypothetical protein